MPTETRYDIKLKISEPKEPPSNIISLKREIMNYYNKSDLNSKISDDRFLPCVECKGSPDNGCKECNNTGKMLTADYVNIIRNRRLLYEDEMKKYNKMLDKLNSIRSILNQEQIRFMFEEAKLDIHVCLK